MTSLRAFGNLLDQGWECDRVDGLVARAPDNQSRLFNASQVRDQVAKRAGDIVNSGSGPFVIQGCLDTHIFR